MSTVPYTHPTHYHKRHLDKVSRFSAIYAGHQRKVRCLPDYQRLCAFICTSEFNPLNVWKNDNKLVFRPRRLNGLVSLIDSMFVLLVCSFITSVYCGKTANSIEMPFKVMGLKHVLDGVQITHENRKICGTMVQCNITRKMRHRPCKNG